MSACLPAVGLEGLLDAGGFVSLFLAFFALIGGFFDRGFGWEEGICLLSAQLVSRKRVGGGDGLLTDCSRAGYSVARFWRVEERNISR